jgi:hypothetical protein
LREILATCTEKVSVWASMRLMVFPSEEEESQVSHALL